MKKELKYKLNKILVYIHCDNPISKKYKLNKIKKYLDVVGLENVNNISIKQDIKDLDSINYSGDATIDSYIDNFVKVIEDKVSKENLINLYNNISWMKIYVLDKINDEWSISTTTLGIYHDETNELKLTSGTTPNVVYHELFHLSSNNPNLDEYAIGFRYGTHEWNIGIGLNEGYTELLVERYFGLEHSHIYNFEKNVVRRLDYIIGKEKMESFYFNYNLFGLINELKQFYTLEEIEKFIINVDFLSVYSENRFLGKNEIYIMTTKLKEIIGFLLKGYSIKLSKTNYNKLIKKKMIEEFLNTFSIDIFNDDVIVNFNDKDYFNNIVNKYLDRPIKLDLNNSQNEKICYNKKRR